jgi:Asp-tRNA(Asn)/Glu-tRNA(Gln) amidotransferase A subunit family amidase
VEEAPEVEEAARRVGARELELPPPFAGLPAAQEALMAHDVAHNLAPEYREHRDGLSQVMREYIERGQAVPAEEAEAGVALAATCRAAWPDGWDALLVPAALGEAPLRSEGHTGDPLLCRAWTLLGAPAISVPGMAGPAGMPIGVQLVGLPGGEERLLGAAAWVEGALSAPGGTS